MDKRLYKVNVEVELVVLANDITEAVEIAKDNASNEIQTYGKGKASVIKNFSELSNDWLNCIPYSNEPTEINCKGILEDYFNKDDIEYIKEVIASRVKSEPNEQIIGRPNLKTPKELKWNESKESKVKKELPLLRLNI
jgi:hypothetical protein